MSTIDTVSLVILVANGSFWAGYLLARWNSRRMEK